MLELPEWNAPSRADKEARRALIGKVPGFVIATDDCRGDCARLAANGVTIVSEPEELPWGISAMFADLYGHVHNLLQPAELAG